MDHEGRKGKGQVHFGGASFKPKVLVRGKRNVHQSRCREKEGGNDQR
jgi:hypothetical protein